MKFKMLLLTALSLPLGACGTTSLFNRPTLAPIDPVVVSPACLVGPVEAQPIEEPPMPEPIVRPAGQPTSSTWDAWLAYEHRRRERAELAGLFFQGERDSYRTAWEMNAETQTQCQAWARRLNQ